MLSITSRMGLTKLVRMNVVSSWMLFISCDATSLLGKGDLRTRRISNLWKYGRKDMMRAFMCKTAVAAVIKSSSSFSTYLQKSFFVVLGSSNKICLPHWEDIQEQIDNKSLTVLPYYRGWCLPSLIYLSFSCWCIGLW